MNKKVLFIRSGTGKWEGVGVLVPITEFLIVTSRGLGLIYRIGKVMGVV